MRLSKHLTSKIHSQITSKNEPSFCGSFRIIRSINLADIKFCQYINAESSFAGILPQKILTYIGNTIYMVYNAYYHRYSPYLK